MRRKARVALGPTAGWATRGETYRVVQQQV